MYDIYKNSIKNLTIPNLDMYNNTYIYILHIYVHRIHGAAIYMVTWIPSIYPSHVSIYIAYIPAPWILWDIYICICHILIWYLTAMAWDPRYGVGYTLTIAKLPHVTVHQPSGMSKKTYLDHGNMMGIWLIYIDL